MIQLEVRGSQTGFPPARKRHTKQPCVKMPGQRTQQGAGSKSKEVGANSSEEVGHVIPTFSPKLAGTQTEDL